MRKLSDFFKKNGFYVGLLCCIALVITAGYVIQSELGTEAPAAPDGSETPVQAFIAEPVIATPDAGEVTPAPKPTAAPAPTAAAAEAVAQEPETAPVIAQAVTSFIMPTDGSIMRTFSAAPVFYTAMGDWRSHLGVDIAAELGSEVKAAADGVVLTVSNDTLLGHTVVIDHGSMKTLYANLHKDILVNPGQEVRKSDPIGYVGTSSLTEGAEETHLHFSVQSGDDYIDPATLLGQ